ncbi:unnamed protein product [Schistosoma mattheei]|uniref:Uncharacterized protein n=1 Tax=Schistosoma mattheei TaxID=31246 RepID=A0A183P341_9TREM|nr:unnamed protein product [Schistosoma mattheei]
MHVDNCGHTFDWKNVEILNRGNPENTKDYLETCHSGESTINNHIGIDPIYQPTNTGPRIKSVRCNQNKEANNDRFNVNKNRSTSRSTGQVVSHMWRNLDTLLLS